MDSTVNLVYNNHPRNPKIVADVDKNVIVQVYVCAHGRPQNSFLGWANHILDRAKGYFNTYHSQILIQISYFVLRISQMSNS